MADMKGTAREWALSWPDFLVEKDYCYKTRTKKARFLINQLIYYKNVTNEVSEKLKADLICCLSKNIKKCKLCPSNAFPCPGPHSCTSTALFGERMGNVTTVLLIIPLAGEEAVTWEL